MLSFRSKLFLLSVVLVFGFIAVTGTYLDVSLRGWLERRIESDLLRQANLVHEALILVAPARDPAHIDPLLDAFGQASDTRITLIAADGRVLGDSRLDLDQVLAAPNHADRPEFAMVRSHGKGRARRTSMTLGTDMLFVAIPFEQPGSEERGSVLRLAIGAEEIRDATSRMRLVILISGLFGLGAAIFMSSVASELMSRTLRDLIETARKASDRPERQKKKSKKGKHLESSSQSGSVSLLTSELERVVATLANERDRFEAVLEGMTEAVIAVDEDHRISLFNTAAEELLGLTEAAQGEAFEAAVAGLDLKALLPPAEASEARTSEFDLPGPPQRKVLVRSAPQRVGAGAIIVMHDVTDLRRLETIRRDFVANVSHELRTPVSVIQANAETLLDGALEDQRHARRFIDAIFRNAERLSRLIADLLDLSRLEADQYTLEFEPCRLRDIAYQTADLVRAKGERPGTRIEVQVDETCTVMADPSALDQILLNLVDNAVKYVPEGSLVEVIACIDGPNVLIEVRDNGPGIAAKHHDRLFERFYRVDKGRSSHMGGTGLGLSIAKHLVTSMGGQIGYRPNAPTGSVFWLTLPRPSTA
jgi:two-component system, OmpR family, phosphate regulon sensor histidine kinase PhoR